MINRLTRSLANTIGELKALVLYGFPFARYSEKCFTQIYRALHGDTMLVPFRGDTNMLNWRIYSNQPRQLRRNNSYYIFSPFLPQFHTNVYIYISETLLQSSSHLNPVRSDKRVTMGW